MSARRPCPRLLRYSHAASSSATTQPPDEHTCSAAQALPQEPQLAGSLCRSVHVQTPLSPVSGHAFAVGAKQPSVPEHSQLITVDAIVAFASAQSFAAAPSFCGTILAETLTSPQ